MSETSVDQIQTRELLPAAGPPLLIRVSTDDSGVATEYVTTTLSDGVVAVLQTATALETQVATVTFTEQGGKLVRATLSHFQTVLTLKVRLQGRSAPKPSLSPATGSSLSSGKS